MRLSNLFIFCVVLVLTSCSVEKSAEQFADGLAPVDGRISIAHIRSMYRYEPLVLSEELWIRGAVVSSDRGGNVVRSVAIEDSTGGIEVLVDAENIFATLFLGDSVSLRCGGLVLGGRGGAVRLGGAPRGDDEVSLLDENDFFERLSFGGHSATPPHVHQLTLREVNARYVGCLVRISGVQFEEGELGQSWCDGAEPTTRYLTDSEGRRIGVRTLPSASFADKPLPEGSGSITALLDYFGSEYQLRPMELMNVNLTEERF